LAKLIVLAVILFTSIVPLVASSSNNPRRTIRRIQIWTCVAVFVWAYLCRTWYPALVPVE
jgi:hypothetical protein